MTDDGADRHTWVWCGHCGAAAWGEPPHGERNPCPLTKERHDQDRRLREEVAAADIAKLDAERMYYVRSGVASEKGMPSIAETLKQMFEKEEE